MPDQASSKKDHPWGVSKTSFETMSVDSKLNVLFDIAETSYEHACAEHDKLDRRVIVLEKQKWWRAGAATIAGLIGGFLAFLGFRPGG